MKLNDAIQPIEMAEESAVYCHGCGDSVLCAVYHDGEPYCDDCDDEDEG